MNEHDVSKVSVLLILFATTGCSPNVALLDEPELLETDTEGGTYGVPDAVPGEEGDGDGATSVAGGDESSSGGDETPRCGDGVVDDGEACDDGGESATCNADCTAAMCGDGIVNASAGEACDDGNDIAGDGCDTCSIACSNGAVLDAESPGGDMVICNDPHDVTCEQDFEQLCPVGWGLCSQAQFVHRNEGWMESVDDDPTAHVLGEIYCREDFGAGHFTVGLYDDGADLSYDAPLNCGYGSARPDACDSGYGCNEQAARALCCAPTPTCGNGVVDSVEEECDDANDDETDDCLSSCSWRVPTAHAKGGVGC